MVASPRSELPWCAGERRRGVGFWAGGPGVGDAAVRDQPLSGVLAGIRGFERLCLRRITTHGETAVLGITTHEPSGGIGQGGCPAQSAFLWAMGVLL